MTVLERLNASRHIQELLALFSFLALMAIGILWIMFNITDLNEKSAALALARLLARCSSTVSEYSACCSCASG